MYKDMLVLYFRICDQFNSQNYTQVMRKSFTLSLEDLLNESIKSSLFKSFIRQRLSLMKIFLLLL